MRLSFAYVDILPHAPDCPVICQASFCCQVLEVFGDPDQTPEATSCSRGPASSVAPPSWQHLGQGLWVFGAHCSGGEACSAVTAVGLVTSTAAVAAGDLQCALWYEGSRHQLQGILSVNTDSLNITTFTCESKYPDKRPYSLAIYRGKSMQYVERMKTSQSNMFQFLWVRRKSSLRMKGRGQPWASASFLTP